MYVPEAAEDPAVVRARAIKEMEALEAKSTDAVNTQRRLLFKGTLPGSM
jgi:hypothetical protein